MAKFQIYDAAPDYQSWADLPAPRQLSRITDGASNTIFAFELAGTGTYAGWKMTCEGTGFTWLANKDGVVEPISGRIDRLRITDGLSNTIALVEQFPDAQRPEISDVYNLMFDGAGDWSRSMWDLLTSITNYADTINGSAHGDDIFSGRNLGNDSIFGFKGNDIVRGNAGTDYYDGGDDYDTLTFVDSFTDYTAYRGINLNSATAR